MSELSLFKTTSSLQIKKNLAEQEDTLVLLPAEITFLGGGVAFRNKTRPSL